MVGVWYTDRLSYPKRQETLIYHINKRVDGFREHGRRTGVQRGRHLEKKHSKIAIVEKGRVNNAGSGQS